MAVGLGVLSAAVDATEGVAALRRSRGLLGVGRPTFVRRATLLFRLGIRAGFGVRIRIGAGAIRRRLVSIGITLIARLRSGVRGIRVGALRGVCIGGIGAVR